MSFLTIGQLAKQASVKATTVRYYERRKLLLAPSRSVAGYRLYPDESVRRLRFIKHAQDLGFTLKEINELLELTATKRSSADVCAVTRTKISSTRKGTAADCVIMKHLYA